MDFIFYKKLQKRPKNRAWEQKEIRLLAKMNRKGKNIRYMASKLNRTEWAINAQINEWRIYK